MTVPSRAEEIMAVGRVEAGVEVGCLVLRTEDATYNVSAAVPRPKVGSYGRITGTVSNRFSYCMQGIVLHPATWEPLPEPKPKTGDP